MKNGIYIEDVGNWKNTIHHYKNNKIIYQEFSNGYKYYLNENGRLHREDGPAVIYPGIFEGWILNGKDIPVKSQEEFERYLLLQAFE